MLQIHFLMIFSAFTCIKRIYNIINLTKHPLGEVLVPSVIYLSFKTHCLVQHHQQMVCGLKVAQKS